MQVMGEMFAGAVISAPTKLAPTERLSNLLRVKPGEAMSEQQTVTYELDGEIALVGP